MVNYLPELPPESIVSLEGVQIKLHLIDGKEWLLTDKQVAEAYGLKVDTVRRLFQRNKETLIEGHDWFTKTGKLSPYCPNLRLWTRDGLIKLGNYVMTSEAKVLLLALVMEETIRKNKHHDYRRGLFFNFLRQGLDLDPVEFELEKKIRVHKVRGLIDALFRQLIIEIRPFVDRFFLKSEFRSTKSTRLSSSQAAASTMVRNPNVQNKDSQI
jgi:hypothetical protein